MTAASGPQGYCPMGQPAASELEAYGEQLTQCPQGTGMGGTIRGDVQRELMVMHAEQEACARTDKPPAPERHYRVDLATDELEQIGRDLRTTLAFMREGSSARPPVLAYIEAIDAELEARRGIEP